MLAGKFAGDPELRRGSRSIRRASRRMWFRPGWRFHLPCSAVMIVLLALENCGAAERAVQPDQVIIGQPTIFWHNGEWQTYKDGVWTPYHRRKAAPEHPKAAPQAKARRQKAWRSATITPTAGIGQNPTTIGQQPGGLGQPTIGIGHTTIGIGQPNAGIGQPTIGIGRPNAGIGRPNIAVGRPQGIGQPTIGIGQPSTDIGPPNFGVGRPQAAKRQDTVEVRKPAESSSRESGDPRRPRGD